MRLIPPDGHNPRHGQKIVDRYTELGMALMITLTDGLAKRKESCFDYFSNFVTARDTSPTASPAPTSTPTISASSVWMMYTSSTNAVIHLLTTSLVYLNVV